MNNISFIVALLCSLSFRVLAICEKPIRQYKSHTTLASEAGKVSVGITTIGSWAGGLWGGLGIIPGSISFGYTYLAKKDLKEFNKCLKNAVTAQEAQLRADIQKMDLQKDEIRAQVLAILAEIDQLDLTGE